MHYQLVLNGEEAIKTVATVLVMNGYTVQVKTTTVGNRKRKVLEYWSEEKNGN